MKTIQLDDVSIELSQPLKDRPDVIVVATSDGRRCVLGDSPAPFTANEYQQIDRQNRFDNRESQDRGES